MDILLIGLLAINFLGVLYIIRKLSQRPQHHFGQQQMHEVLLQQIIKNKQEIAELKLLLSQQHQQLLEEIAKVKSAQVQQEKTRDEEEILFLNERYEEVFALKQKGLTAEEIAKRLDKGYGEIDFILQLAGKEKKE